MAKRKYKYAINSNEFKRIPGPERKYREKKTGRVVSRSYVYARSERKAISVGDMRRQRERRQGVHDNRVMWYKNHHNHEAWLRGAPPSSYMSKQEAENDQEFINMEALIHSSDEGIRDIGYDYFDGLEHEYESVDWGETP